MKMGRNETIKRNLYNKYFCLTELFTYYGELFYFRSIDSSIKEKRAMEINLGPPIYPKISLKSEQEYSQVTENIPKK